MTNNRQTAWQSLNFAEMQKKCFCMFSFFRFPKGGQTSDPGRESFCRNKMFACLHICIFAYTLFILLSFLLMILSVNNFIHRFTFEQVYIFDRTLGEAAPCRPKAGTIQQSVLLPDSEKTSVSLDDRQHDFYG